MAYDLEKRLKKLISELRKSGDELLAEDLYEALSGGSTGTEITDNLRMRLSEAIETDSLPEGPLHDLAQEILEHLDSE